MCKMNGNRNGAETARSKRQWAPPTWLQDELWHDMGLVVTIVIHHGTRAIGMAMEGLHYAQIPPTSVEAPLGQSGRRYALLLSRGV